MSSDANEKRRYITATRDEEGKNEQKVKEWEAKGLLTDCQLTSTQIRLSFKDGSNVTEAINILGI